MQGQFSSYRDINVGVRQRSLSRSLLFKTFINNLNFNFFIPNISLRLYAGGAVGYLSAVSPAGLQRFILSSQQLISINDK